MAAGTPSVSLIYTRPAWTNSKWSLVITLMIGSGLSSSDASLVGVAMPQMAATLSVPMSTLTWVAATYTISMLITASMSGWLISRIGYKRLYMYALGLFFTTSFLSGLAPSFEALLVTRVLQGLGAGPLPPLGNAILLSTYPPKERASIMSIFVLGPGIGMAIAPVFGGWFIEVYNWRWVFFLNAPIGCLGLFLGSRVLVDPPSKGNALSRIDFVGMGLLISSLVALQVFLLRGPREQWFSSDLIIWTGIMAVVCLAGLIWWEWREDAPVLNLRVFQNGVYLVGFIIIFLYGMSFFSNPYILPLYFQKLRGFTAFHAGLMLLPQAVVSLVLTPVIGRIYNRFGGPFLITTGMFLVAGGYLDLSHLQLETSGFRMLPALLLTGGGLACMRAAIVPAATQTLPISLLGAASSLVVLGRRIGGNIAYAVVVTQIAERTEWHRAHLVTDVSSRATEATNFLTRITTHFAANGIDLRGAANGANQLLYQLVENQSRMQAYNDIFLFSGLLFVGCAPLVILSAWCIRTSSQAHSTKSENPTNTESQTS